VCLQRLLTASMGFALLPPPAIAMRVAASRLHLQESGADASLGKLRVPGEKMAGRCVTMVSPIRPYAAGDLQEQSVVIVEVVIWKSGRVSPVRVVSGTSSLEAEAMNAVRLWRYKPYIQDDQPVDVSTEIRVTFKPGEPGGMITHPSR
jgi:TonB family protein